MFKEICVRLRPTCNTVSSVVRSRAVVHDVTLFSLSCAANFVVDMNIKNYWHVLNLFGDACNRVMCSVTLNGPSNQCARCDHYIAQKRRRSNGSDRSVLATERVKEKNPQLE